MLAAIFLSNFPEGLSSALGMKAAGRSKSYIFGLWVAIVLVSGVASLIGAAVFGSAPSQVVAAVNAVAAGALLTMVVNTMIPEAVEGEQNFTGSLVLLGLLVAFSLSNSAETNAVAEDDRRLVKRLHRLEEKIEAARREELRDEDHKSSDPQRGSGLTRAIGLSAEVVGAVGVGVAIGIGLDWLLGTSPWGLIIFFMLGFAAGVLNLIREARRISSAGIE
jgi:F0F1-type ATP synthase assembly protein I